MKSRSGILTSILIVLILAALVALGAIRVEKNRVRTEEAEAQTVQVTQAETSEEITETTEETKKTSFTAAFIGNSYTFRNDMAKMCAAYAADEGIEIIPDVYGFDGAYLSEHLKDEKLVTKIAYGDYDIIVLQEESHFVRQKTEESAAVIQSFIDKAPKGTKIFLYETMSYRREPELQPKFHEAYEKLSELTGLPVIHVGDEFWKFADENKDIKMFEDAQHPSQFGYELVAKLISDSLVESCR